MPLYRSPASALKYIRDTAVRESTPNSNFGLLAFDRNNADGPVEIALSDLLSPAGSRYLVAASGVPELLISGDTRVHVDADKYDTIHWNLSSFRVTWDVSNIEFNRPYFFLNGSSGTATLDAGRGAVIGPGTLGQMLDLGPNDAVTIRRLSVGLYYIVAKYESPAAQAGSSGTWNYRRESDGSWTAFSYTNISANSDSAVLSLPSFFGTASNFQINSGSGGAIIMVTPLRNAATSSGITTGSDCPVFNVVQPSGGTPGSFQIRNNFAATMSFMITVSRLVVP